MSLVDNRNNISQYAITNTLTPEFQQIENSKWGTDAFSGLSETRVVAVEGGLSTDSYLVVARGSGSIAEVLSIDSIDNGSFTVRRSLVVGITLTSDLGFIWRKN